MPTKDLTANTRHWHVFENDTDKLGCIHFHWCIQIQFNLWWSNVEFHPLHACWYYYWRQIQNMKFSSETPSIKSEASKCKVKNKQHSHCVIIHLNLKLSCVEVITNNETKTFLSKTNGCKLHTISCWSYGRSKLHSHWYEFVCIHGRKKFKLEIIWFYLTNDNRHVTKTLPTVK